MSKCQKCHCKCHCDEELHSHHYDGDLCACEGCKCNKNKRTYTYEKDHGHDISYENEVKYDFSDVLIKPKRSYYTSRKEVDLEREFKFKWSNLMCRLLRHRI